MLTATFAVLFYTATVVLVLGLAARVYLYARTPAPLRIPTTPAPTSRGGAALRVTSEVVAFRSLFRGEKLLWLLSWAFHVALLLVILRHLRYFLDPAPQWLVWIQPLGLYAAYVLAAALVGLWLRRLWIDRVRHISTPSDHAALALLLAIGLTGLGLQHFQPTDIVAVKAFFIGLMQFNWQPLPSEPLLLLHLTLVALLMMVFPFSKLLHAAGVFFSPTRNQPDNPRERRHIAPWARALEQDATHQKQE
ncbi:respiratory nitrate reductase subunit gamma [Halorhodospira halophila]|uniref:Nitrate reductase, gamma subunit n=1 Tax=Halorhodospira halophila (strain DSM 244 / SL1) TaxID=349124 RepID=A1WYF9_HALHL|nr:Nitrate reductase, gamma subunit [Halorhodospira halophila SL1]MBK1728402.1 nitrate reductase [Halorhodospira halophila]